MKKIVVIVIILVVVGALAFFGYYLRSRNEPITPTPAGGPGNLPTVQLPPTTPGGNGAGQATGPTENLKTEVNVPVVDYFVGASNALTFVRPDGQILKTDADGIEPLSASVVKNLSAASFSFDGKKVLATMGTPSENQSSVFDAEKKTWQPLPQGASAPAWSPNNYQVAYFLNGADGSVLSSLDAAGPTSTKPKTLLSLRQEDITVRWLAPNQMLLADKTSALWNSSLWSFDPAKKVVSAVIQDRPGLETIWSSASSSFGLMFSANRNQQGGQLRLVDKSGNALKQLNFLTLPSKCVFYDKPADTSVQAASSTATSTNPSTSLGASVPPSAAIQKLQTVLICAVPRDQQTLSNSMLPDAYRERALFTSDDFFEINANDGSVKALFSDPARHFDASNVKIFSQSVFFINRFDKKAYSFPLARQ